MLTAGLALHTDKYQINMMYAHWINGSHRTRAVFEAYFRKRHSVTDMPFCRS